MFQQTANVFADVYITLAHIFILRGLKAFLVTETSSVGCMLHKLIVYTATRGLLLTAVQLLEMTTVWCARPVMMRMYRSEGFKFIVDSTHNTYVSMAVMLPQSTLYCNSVLAVLNVRRHIRSSKSTSPRELALLCNSLNTAAQTCGPPA
ncbi:uncharacterized protein B0H18DRAFT_212209 [Fomitopsis serialis]|uniref:uncharacterized protein n=1 Tax=Fomitopsis serialis TaxID=139415 RepID=UPI0020085BBB|nr:uncharacterized protein B0H18DRAFT_212209 [Neoantrodia serialis]KAH9929447.1 hypothetical protein B0H18DRAFT_212209 [Neoantrodia serialis]